MMGDDPRRCPKCDRYVDDETPTLDHADGCPWSDLTFEAFQERIDRGASA